MRFEQLTFEDKKVILENKTDNNFLIEKSILDVFEYPNVYSRYPEPSPVVLEELRNSFLGQEPTGKNLWNKFIVDVISLGGKIEYKEYDQNDCEVKITFN
jgi:hypothetical protein